MAVSLGTKEKQLRFILVTLVSFLLGGACCSYARHNDSPIVWLDFKLPPHYNKERKEIMEVTRKRYPGDLKRWSKIKNFNFDAMAVADLDGDGKPNVALVLIAVEQQDNGFVEGRYAFYKKEKGRWLLWYEATSTGDMYYVRNDEGQLRFVSNGCAWGYCVAEDDVGCGLSLTGSGPYPSIGEFDYYTGPYKSPARAGTWLPYFNPKPDPAIVSIVERELRSEIANENKEYKKHYGVELGDLPSIAGVFEDVNGDGKPDIIARMNDINRFPWAENPPPLFCDESECDYYLLLNKGDDTWQKEPLGRTTCVALSKPDKKGVRQLYTNQATFVWDGATYKKVPYKPNWMVKKPVKATPEPASSVIWLDFKLPPYYDQERKEIMEVTRKKYPDKLQRWSKVKNFNFDAMTVADLDGDGKPDVAFVVIEIRQFDDGSINATLAPYKKYKGEWTLSGNRISTGDLYYVTDRTGKFRLVTDGCIKKEDGLNYYFGPYKSPTRKGIWLPYFPLGDYKEITSIVNKELRPEIAAEMQEYRENNEQESMGLAISGAFQDVNGDRKPDIIVRMNDIYRGPGERPDPPFCNNLKCDYYLLLSKGNDQWQKELLGRTSCIGLSKPDMNGAMQLYTDQATFLWDGTTYKKIPYKPNWMIKEPIKPEDGLL